MQLIGRQLLQLAILAILVCACLRAQTVPNFSGSWVVDSARSGLTRVGDAGSPPPTVQPPKRTKYVLAEYPAALVESRTKVAGEVAIEATIDTRGNVTDAEVVMSVPALDRSALSAVRQWKYTPASVNNAPVPVTMTVTVNFTLSGVSPTAAKPTGVAVRRWLSSHKVAITQDATSLTLAGDGPKGPQVTMYFLNGAEVTNTFLAFVPSVSRQPAALLGVSAEFRSRSHWDGDKLVTTIKPDLTETRYLDGEVMVVETVTTDTHDGKPNMSKLVYRKVG